MKEFFQKNITLLFRLAPITLLLAIFVIYFFVFLDTDQGKKEAISAIKLTKAKGASIIHSFEATLFASRPLTNDELETLLMEQANSKGILFIALIDKDGKITHSSDETLLNAYFPSINELKEIETKHHFAKHTNYDDNSQNISDNVHVGTHNLEDFKKKNSSFGINLKNLYDLKYNHILLIEKQLFYNSNTKYPRNLERYTKRMRDLSKAHAENSKNHPQEELWKAKRFQAHEDGISILIAFDISRIKEAEKIDKKRNLIQGISFFSILILSIFSFFILRAFQRSYHNEKGGKAYILSLLNALPLGIITLNHKKEILSINPSAESLIRETNQNLLGKNIYDIIPEVHELDFQKPIKNKKITVYSHTNQPINVEISTFSIKISAYPDEKLKKTKISELHHSFEGIGIILRDLREIQLLQEELQKQEKLAAVGKLAAGIAHEIRNPLGTIKGIARFFEEKALESLGKQDEQSKNQSEDVKLASIMTQEIMRVDKVIKDLLELSKPNTVNPKEVDIKELIEKAKNSVLLQAGTRISFTEQIDKSCINLYLDEDRIIQVLQNILLNAIQAIDNKGIIEINASCISQNAQSKDRVLELQIIDNGRGISEENIKNLFTPYYTDKASGTGLGIVMVQKIIEAHNGTVQIQSELGKGTKVTIRIKQ